MSSSYYENTKTPAPEPDASKFEWAIFHAANGFRVFRLRANGKTPLQEGWQAEATTNSETIRRWWGNGQDHNIGIFMSDEWATLDFDCKPKLNIDGTAKLDENGQQVVGRGLEALFEFDTADGLPQGYRQETPTGGQHVILRVPEGAKVRNSANKLRPDVDVRGQGGLVVAAGSTIDEKSYRWLGGQQDEMPALFVARCGKPRDRADDTQTPLVELDQPRNIDRAVRYLRDVAEEAVVGAGANDQIFRTACEVKDYGISRDLCIALLSEHYNEAGKIIPPLDHDEIADIASNAYAYGSSPPGIADPAVEFERSDDLDEPIGEASTAPRNDRPEQKGKVRGEQVDLSAPKAFTPRPWLIKGLVPEVGVGFIGGQSGSYKSFLTLDMAVAIASGQDWVGHRVKRPGGVLLLPFEGEGTVDSRLAARRTTLEDPDTHLPIRMVRGFGVLNSVADYHDLDATLVAHREAFKEMGVEMNAIVIDTVIAAGMLSEAEENDSAAWQRVIRWLNALAQKFRVAIMLVHHAGKNALAGLRGASGSRGAADFVLMISCERNELTGKSGERKLALTKSRDGAEGILARVDGVRVMLGKDDDGDDVTSLVMEYTLDQQATARSATRPSKAAITFRAAYAEAGGDGSSKGVPLGELREAFMRLYPAEDKATRRKAFERARKGLADTLQYVVQDGVEFVVEQFEPSAMAEFDKTEDLEDDAEGERDTMTSCDLSQSHGSRPNRSDAGDKLKSPAGGTRDIETFPKEVTSKSHTPHSRNLNLIAAETADLSSTDSVVPFRRRPDDGRDLEAEAYLQ